MDQQEQAKRKVALIYALESEEQPPWALREINGTPLVHHLHKALQISEITATAILVSPTWVDRFKKVLGNGVTYLVIKGIQDFGQAVLQAEDWLNEFADEVLLLYADQPLLRAEQIRSLLAVPLPREAVGCIPLFPPKIENEHFWAVEQNSEGNIVSLSMARNNMRTSLPWRFEWDCLQRALYQVETPQATRPLPAVIEKVTDNGFKVLGCSVENPNVFLRVTNPKLCNRVKTLLSQSGEAND